MSIRALLVDDEPLARERLRTLLAQDPDVTVVGEAGDGLTAVRACVEQSVDLMFLDVQMPEMDGFEVLETLARLEAEGAAAEPSFVPAVVFVTAYDRYALRAFEVHALDYLLKPFDGERFADCLQRIREQLEGQRARMITRRLYGLIAETKTRAPRAKLERLLVRSRGRVFFVQVEDVDWIEAAGNYIALHVGPRQHLIRETMAGIERRLPRDAFQRVHRSAIVRLDRVRELVARGGGDYELRLASGDRLPVARTYSPRVRRRLIDLGLTRSS